MAKKQKTSRRDKRPQRTKKHTQSSVHFSRAIALRVLYYFLVCGFIASLFYCALFAPFLVVRNIEIVGSDRVAAQTLSRDIAQTIAGTRLLTISNANILLISRGAVTAHITDNYPEIAAVTVVKQFPDTLRVEVREYDTIVVVCPGSAQAPDEICGTLDTEGILARKESLTASHITRNPSEIIVLRDGNMPDEIGTQVLEPETRENLLYILRELPFTINARSVNRPTLTSLGSTHLEVRTDEGWMLRLDLAHNPRLTLDVLRAFFDQTTEVDLRQNLEEIDVRLLDKVFYRTKKEPEITEEAEFAEDAGEAIDDETAGEGAVEEKPTKETL